MITKKNVYKVEIIVGRYFLGSYVFNGLGVSQHLTMI
jgi:hypothetical protein